MPIKAGFSEISEARLHSIAEAIHSAAQASARHADPILIAADLAIAEPLIKEIESMTMLEITKAGSHLVDKMARALIAYHAQRNRARRR